MCEIQRFRCVDRQAFISPCVGAEVESTVSKIVVNPLPLKGWNRIQEYFIEQWL